MTSLLCSICMTTYNGESFIRDQLESILSQIPENAELIISDNGSNDNTISIIESFDDHRIKLIHCKEKNLIRNFENTLYSCKGDIIFLSDQDDVWLSNKFDVFTKALEKHDVVVSDCIVTNVNLEKTYNSFYFINKSAPGLLKNIFRNSYIGCCMAFNRKILSLALPIPSNIPMHDWWIGLIGEIYGNPLFIKDKTLLYRRHNNNFSPSTEKSISKLSQKIAFRINIVFNLFARVVHERKRN